MVGRRQGEPAARVSLGDAPAAAGLYRPSLGGGLASRRSRQLRVGAVTLRDNPRKLPMRCCGMKKPRASSGSTAGQTEAR